MSLVELLVYTVFSSVRRPSLFGLSVDYEAGDYKKWVVNYAVNARSMCKDPHCLEFDRSIPKGALKIGRRFPSPYAEGEFAINWFHPKCMFSQQLRARASTKVLTEVEDLEGYENMQAEDQAFVEELIRANHTGNPDFNSMHAPKHGAVKQATIDKNARAAMNKGRRETGRRDIGRVLMM